MMKEAVAAVWDRFSPAGIANLFHQVTNQQAAKQRCDDGGAARVDLRSRAHRDPGSPGRMGGLLARVGRDQRLHRSAQPLPDAPARRRSRR